MTIFSLAALPSFRLFESTDLDETRERISAVMQPHSLLPLSRGAIRSRMDFVQLGRLGIGSITFGHAMRVRVESIDDYYLLMFCVSGNAEVRSGGQTLQVNDTRGVLCAPGQEFDAALSEDCQQLVLRIDPGSLASRTRILPPCAGVEVGGPALRGWIQQLALVTGSPDLLACARENPGVAQRLEGLMLELLVSGHVPTGAPQPRAIVMPGYLRRAEAFIRENLGGPLELDDISRAVGVAPRTLRDGFQQFKQTSPMQFVRASRLALAREMLLAPGAHGRIADIALDCGFGHLGRFAIAYKARFGESPSMTARKARTGR